MKLVMTTMRSPLGELRLYARRDALAGVYLPDHTSASLRDAARPGEAGPCGQPAPAAERGAADVLAHTKVQLAAYFAGERRAFDLPLDPEGTPFAQRVWRALLAIPYGETRTYGELARALGHPAASRAVGAANARNPLSIVVPCHRVIAASGALTGYAGGLPAKRWLLDHERRATAPVLALPA